MLSALWPMSVNKRISKPPRPRQRRSEPSHATLRICARSSSRSSASQPCNATSSTRTSTFSARLSPVLSLPALRSPSPRRRTASRSATDVLERVTIRSDSSWHSMPCSQRSRLLLHGECQSFTSVSLVVMLFWIMLLPLVSQLAAPRASLGLWTRTWPIARMKLVSSRTPIPPHLPICGSSLLTPWMPQTSQRISLSSSLRDSQSSCSWRSTPLPAATVLDVSTLSRTDSSVLSPVDAMRLQVLHASVAPTSISRVSYSIVRSALSVINSLPSTMPRSFTTVSTSPQSVSSSSRASSPPRRTSTAKSDAVSTRALSPSSAAPQRPPSSTTP